ncbi:hypothetical protein C5167_035937 [Papaver somniferum]|nr:hypothetical protein C5167_035937 [Papaver somniferum]
MEHHEEEEEEEEEEEAKGNSNTASTTTAEKNYTDEIRSSGGGEGGNGGGGGIWRSNVDDFWAFVEGNLVEGGIRNGYAKFVVKKKMYKQLQPASSSFFRATILRDL